MRLLKEYLLFVSASCSLAAACDAVRAQEGLVPAGVLTLNSGDTLLGEFRPSAEPGAVRWQATGFVQPFEFETTSISSIRLPAEMPPVQQTGEFAVELIGGDILTGRFTGWSEESVGFASTHFGELTIRRASIRGFSRLDDNPALVFPGLSGLTGWQITSGEWREDGAQLRTESDGAALNADVMIPERAVIEVEVSWSQSPNFVFAIGVDPASAADDRLQGWRLETWDLVLAAVREQSQTADVAHIQELQVNGRVHLIAYLDRTAGDLQVVFPDGKPAGRISVKTEEAPRAQPAPRNPARRRRGAREEPMAANTSGGGVRLINRHGEIRLERLRIARWNGVLPSTLGPNEARIELKDAGVAAVSGQIIGLDADTQQFVVRDSQGERTIPLNDIGTVDLSAESHLPPSAAAALLQDGTRLSGSILEIRGTEMVLASSHITEPLVVPLLKLRSLNVAAEAVSAATNESEGKRGRLEMGEHKLSGRLVAGRETTDAHCLVWHPVGSRTSSPLLPDASGRIVYREVPKPVTRSQEEEARQEAELQMRRLEQRRAGNQEPNLFAKLFLKQADEPRVARAEPGPQNLHLRSGDVITCTVTAIDESGVAIESPATDARTIPHDRIKAVELDAKTAQPNMEQAKKDRLLTLPRLQASSPPTHLLCARNGDFLRCRLLSLTAEHARVEVQLEEIEIPRDRVAQIVWFHDDELEPPAAPAAAKQDTSAGGGASSPPAGDTGRSLPPVDGMAAPAAAVTESASDSSAANPQDFRRLVQILQRGGRRVTFDPEDVDQLVISGESEVLGACRFPLDDMDQLLFGERIKDAAAVLAYHQWRLHQAVLPRIAQDLGAGDEDSGTVSPLVGQPAPEIDLELLGGGQFKLSQQKGQIVVLDFWATWCGPCMQTIPLLEAAMQEFDPAQVQFVSVNLEERPDHVKSVLERSGLNLTVALDIDGVAARRYEANAIPQLVVVDREGRVARLYVGGGPNVVDELKTTLAEMIGP